MNPSEKTRAACVISHWLLAHCVAHIFPPFGLPLAPHFLWTPVPSPAPYQSPFGLAVHLYSGPRVPVDLHSTCNIQQESLSFWLNPFVCLCEGVGLCTIGVCGSFYLKELLKLVWQECQLCWPSSFSDFSLPLLSRMKRRQAMVPVSITSPDI